MFITYTTTDGVRHDSHDITDSGTADPNEPPAPLPTLAAMPGWSADATPTTASRADVDACVAAIAGRGAGSASAVLAESRGDFESLLVEHSSDGDQAYCVVKNGIIQWSNELGEVKPGQPSAPDAAQVVQELSVDGTVASTRLEIALGDAGVGVTSVILHFADNLTVTATVNNGTWMAWWPAAQPAALAAPGASAPPTEAPAPTGPPIISWTTTDGVSHDAP
ncbi:MAG: hypothetical protein JWQ64_3158 [Subtercola sp.]|nr:hypothetical protein [Subtercola sp.]